MIVVRISSKSLNVSPCVTRVSTVYSQILIVVVIADIPLSEFFVDRVSLVWCLGMASVG